MMRQPRYFTPLLVAVGLSTAVLAAPVAAAAPECVNTGPTTIQCQNQGNAQISTSPQVSSNDFPWFGWPYTGLVNGASIVG